MSPPIESPQQCIVTTISYQPQEQPLKRLFLKEFGECLAFERYPSRILDDQIWRDVHYEPSLCLGIGRGAEWKAFGMGVIRGKNKAKPMGYIKFFAVHPKHRMKGLGSLLLSVLEQRLFAAGANAIRLGESAPHYLMPGLDPRYTAAWAFFAKKGYGNIGHTFNMHVGLSGFQNSAPRARSNQVLEFRRARSNDLASLMSFLKGEWPSWCEEVGPVFKRNPIPLFLAFEESNLVGFAAYDCQNEGIGWFGPMGTLPSARGKGVGQKLLHLVLEDLNKQGQNKAIIPWVGPVGFYQKHCGAEIERVFFRFEKHEP